MDNENFMVSKRQKIWSWIKKYGYYVALAISVVAVGVAVTFTLINGTDEIEDVGGNTAIVFAMPVVDGTVLTEYSGDTLLYSETLGHWEAHKAIDLKAAEGADVLAALAGTVTSISTDLLEGTKIVITHENGLVTTYASLASTAKVSVGDIVTKGQAIGSVANTAGSETALGAHLHFLVTLNAVKVDPTAYLPLSDK